MSHIIAQTRTIRVLNIFVMLSPWHISYQFVLLTHRQGDVIMDTSEHHNERIGKTMALRNQDFDENDEHTVQATKRSRITIDISPELRRRIKLAAIENDLSISEYVGQILEEAVPDEVSTTQRQRHQIPDDFLEQVYRVREQVIRDSKGELFEDSTEMIRQMREERTRQLTGES